jgi:predicted nucleotidyltransferase
LTVPRALAHASPVPSAFLDAIHLVQGAAVRHGFRVALIGGFALPFHGVRRATGDVDFLVEARGGDALHDALTAAGYATLHRSADAANYRGEAAGVVGVDVLYARRPPTIAMLDRAALPAGGGDVRVVDVEGLIGLKLQALVNDPARRRQDEADIVALLTIHLPSLDRALLEGYFALFDRRDDLTRFLDEAAGRRG